MKTENQNLHELWKGKALAAPSHEEILERADKLKHSIRKRSIVMTLVLLVTLVAVFMIWSNAERQALIGSVGVTLIAVALSMGIVNFIKMGMSLTQKNLSLDVDSYIKQMLAMKQQQELSQTKILSGYYALLTVGVAFYVYEPASQMELLQQSFTWLITLGWLAFVWFYLRPRAIKKQKEKFDFAITKLQSITGQLAAE
jgi:hypothetical protein